MKTDEDAVPQLSVPPLRDRKEAGELLADSLAPYQHQDDVILLGLPRGGIPEAAEVRALLGNES